MHRDGIATHNKTKHSTYICYDYLHTDSTTSCYYCHCYSYCCSQHALTAHTNNTSFNHNCYSYSCSYCYCYSHTQHS
jgi:hypothetical protein